jgi:hypothetical protein
MDVAQELVRDGVRESKLEIEFDFQEDEGEDESAYSTTPYGPYASGPQGTTVLIRLIILGGSVS